MTKHHICITFILIVLLNFSGLSQILYPDSELQEYYKIVEIKNTGLNDRMGISPSIITPYLKDSLTWNLWKNHVQFEQQKNKNIQLLPVRILNSYNSTYARGYNDGALWKGKGYTGSVQGGVSGKLGLLEFTIAPMIYFSQNSSFELAEETGNNNSNNYQFRNQRIDFVQRYGDKSFTKFNLGQTDLRLVYKSFTIGTSTQNVIWGPAQRNPLILSNNASGIPHIDIGTYKPVQTKIGRLEGKIYYGSLKKSDYFDDSNEWNYRYWSGMSVSYNPSFLPSLYLGFNRAFYKKSHKIAPLDLLVFIDKFDDTDGDPAINDEYDQIGSFTIKWMFKEAKFESYIEYGKNDFGGKVIGSTPEHSRAYTLGFSKYVDIKTNNILKLTYEHSSLDKPKNYVYRGNNSWYSHQIVKQGYTLDGQVLGAGIGSGSVSDYFEAHYFFEQGRLQLIAQRIRFDDDYFFSEIKDGDRHDHEWTLESRYSRFMGTYLVSIDFGISFRENQYFIENNDKKNIFVGLNFTKTFN